MISTINTQKMVYQLKMERFIDAVCQAFDKIPDLNDREHCYGAFNTLLALAIYKSENDFAVEFDKIVPSDKGDEALARLRSGLKEINHICRTTTGKVNKEITEMLLDKVQGTENCRPVPTF
ncbi:MAG: hypothetical protein H2069_04155 [Legionella sp.]|nr:hypothetical protein [Legionella sp.]